MHFRKESAIRGLILAACAAASVIDAEFAQAQPTADAPIEQWGVATVTLDGPREGNPFVDVKFSATFQIGDHKRDVVGFYDGDGKYVVRFMPDRPGPWSYTTHSNNTALAGKTGDFTVVPPTGANHGPVHVRNTFHFAYADGSPYKPLGTTCYAWTSHPAELEEQTLKTLVAAPFNKLRMCVFPKRYVWNENEPPL